MTFTSNITSRADAQLDEPMTHTSNVVTVESLTEVDYETRDEDGVPLWIRNTGPKPGSVLRSQRVGLRSYRPSDQPSKEELRAAAEAAVASYPITRID